MVGQIGDLRTNLIKFIRDYNATKLENENLTQLVANDEHKRKLEVSLNDCREKMHQFHSENLQKEGSIKDLEYKLSQITKENDEVVKKRDSAIEEIMNQLAIKANEYKTTHEKLVEAQSTAEIFAEKNANLKLDHETKIENLQVEIQKLKRHIDQIENEKFNATSDLSTKLARTEEILMEYRTKVNIAEEKAQKLTENHHKSRQQFELVVEHLRGEIQSLKELLVKQNDEHNFAMTKSTKPSPTKSNSPLMKKKEMKDALRNISDELGSSRIPIRSLYGTPKKPNYPPSPAKKAKTVRLDTDSQVIQEDYRAPSEEFNSSQVLSDSPPWDYNKSVSFCGDATEKQSQLLNNKHSFVAPSPPKQRKKKSHKLWNDRFDDDRFDDSKKLKPSHQGIPNFGAMLTNAHKGEMVLNANKSANKYLPKSSANHTLPSKEKSTANLTENNQSSLNKSTAFHRLPSAVSRNFFPDYEWKQTETEMQQNRQSVKLPSAVPSSPCLSTFNFKSYLPSSSAQHESSSMQQHFVSGFPTRNDKTYEEKPMNENRQYANNPRSSAGIPGLSTLNFNMPLTKSSVYHTLPSMISRNFPNGNGNEEHSSGYESSDSNKSNLKHSLRKVSDVFNLDDYKR